MSAVSESGFLTGFEKVVSTALWSWIDSNMDTDVFTVRIWVVRKTFKVRDLLPFAELLLGPNPGVTAAIKPA